MSNATINISKKLKEKVKVWEKENTYYGVIPIIGDSMECNNQNSIPNGSYALISELKIKSTLDIPIKEPIIIQLNIYGKKEPVAFCKEILNIDNENKTILLNSYNTKYGQKNYPTSSIHKVFEIHKVFKSKDELVSLN